MEASGEGKGVEEEEEEEEERPDPRTFKPDLYSAAQSNDTDRVIELLLKDVPPTFVDDSNGWTVSCFAALRTSSLSSAHNQKFFSLSHTHKLTALALGGQKRQRDHADQTY